MIIYLILILCILIFFKSNENFSYFNLNYNFNTPISHNNLYDTYQKVDFNQSNLKDINQSNVDIFDNRINLKNIASYKYNNIETTNKLESNNCCLIKKKFDSGNFSYNYLPLKNEQCNIDLYELDNNNKLLFDGVNNWSNKNCNNNNTILGSCKKANMECIDFVTEEECNKFSNNIKANYFLKFNITNQPTKFFTKAKWSMKTCQG